MKSTQLLLECKIEIKVCIINIITYANKNIYKCAYGTYIVQFVNYIAC